MAEGNGYVFHLSPKVISATRVPEDSQTQISRNMNRFLKNNLGPSVQRDSRVTDAVVAKLNKIIHRPQPTNAFVGSTCLNHWTLARSSVAYSMCAVCFEKVFIWTVKSLYAVNCGGGLGCRWLAGWLTGWLACLLACWLAGVLAGLLAG